MMTRSVLPIDVAPIIPVWLEIEKDYANQKHGSSNPQVTALSGGLKPGGSANQDFGSYYGRFRFFSDHADGNESLMIKASQQLGKFVGVGRALLRVCLQERDGLNVQTADDRAFDIISDRLVFPGRQIASVPEAFDEVVLTPALSAIDTALGIDIERATDLTVHLVTEQARLFAGYSALTGLIATPGISSTDEHSQLDNWYVAAPVTVLD